MGDEPVARSGIDKKPALVTESGLLLAARTAITGGLVSGAGRTLHAPTTDVRRRKTNDGVQTIGVFAVPARCGARRHAISIALPDESTYDGGEIGTQHSIA